MRCVNVEERHDAEHALLVGPTGRERLALADVDREAAVAEVGALGPSRRAARVLQRREGVRCGQGVRERGLRVAPPPRDVGAAGADRDPVLDAEIFGQRRDHLGRVRIVKHGDGVGVVEDQTKLALGVDRVGRHRLRAGGVNGEGRDGHLDRVADDERDAAAAGTERDQLVREAADASAVLGIAQGLVAADDGGPIGRRVGGGIEHVDDRREDRRQVLVVGHRLRRREFRRQASASPTEITAAIAVSPAAQPVNRP